MQESKLIKFSKIFLVAFILGFAVSLATDTFVTRQYNEFELCSQTRAQYTKTDCTYIPIKASGWPFPSTQTFEDGRKVSIEVDDSYFCKAGCSYLALGKQLYINALILTTVFILLYPITQHMSRQALARFAKKQG